MKSLLTLLIIAGTMAIVSMGCYTVLKHPMVNEEYSESDYQQDCLTCHPDYHNYPYGYFYGSYPQYWWSEPRWGHYYAYPWWWDYYWYRDDRYDHRHDEGDETITPAVSGEKAVRRDALRPPYSFRNTLPSYRGGDTENPSTKQTVSSGDKTNPPDNSGNDSKKNDDKKKEEKKETKKVSRRGGEGR